MSLAHKILGNTFIQFFGRVVSALLAVISVKLITHYLGVDGYGSYTTVYEFVGLFSIVGDLGLYTIAVREMADKEGDEQKIYSNVLAMRAIFTFIVMILVGVGGMFIPKYTGTVISLGIWICTLGVWLNLFYSIISSILQYHLKMQKATIALLIGKIVGVLVVAYAVFFVDEKTTAFYIMVGAGIAAHGVMALIVSFYAKKYAKIKFTFDFDYWKYLIVKAWPYGLALILGTIYFKIDVTLLSLMRDQTEVGFYGVPLRMTEVLVVLPLFFMNSVLGTMTKAVKEKGDRIQKIFSLSLQFLLTAAIPIFLFVYFFASDIVRLISKPEFLAQNGNPGSDTAFLLLTIALVVSFFSTLCSFTLVAFHQQKRVLWINGSGALFNLLTNLYFIPIYGFIGAALTSIASEVLIFFIALYFLKKTYPFKFNWKMILNTLFGGILVFTAFYFSLPFMESLNVLVKILLAMILGVSVYIPYLLLTKTIKKEDMFFISSSS